MSTSVTASGVRVQVEAMIEHGVPCRIKYYTASGALASYDSDVAYVQSGNNVWSSGLVFPVNANRGSTEAVLLEQGRLLTSDKVIYFTGTVSLSGSLVKVGVGSPTPVEHTIMPDGVNTYQINNENVYNKVFVRLLRGGSILGE